MYEENKLEELEGKNDAFWNNFTIKGSYEFEGLYKKSGVTYQDDILKDDSPKHKGISSVLS